ncbi:MAG: response regulator, partial [Gammaproteobacteria bacterium]|nr:response regulator [Gammaproteobacteria bacterium]
MSSSNEVWVIDDDRSIRWVLEKALTKAGMHVTSFSNANGVMEALERGQPEAVISDVRMPGMDGFVLLERIKQAYPDLPVVIMTAHSDLDSAVSAYHSGAFEYLPKPFDIAEAVDQVERACKLRRESRASNDNETVAPTEIIGAAPAMQEVFRAIG